MSALRFLLKGGLSSGVNGVFEPDRAGLGERLCERDETEDEVRLLELEPAAPDAILLPPVRFS